MSLDGTACVFLVPGTSWNSLLAHPQNTGYLDEMAHLSGGITNHLPSVYSCRFPRVPLRIFELGVVNRYVKHVGKNFVFARKDLLDVQELVALPSRSQYRQYTNKDHPTAILLCIVCSTRLNCCGLRDEIPFQVSTAKGVDAIARMSHHAYRAEKS